MAESTKNPLQRPLLNNQNQKPPEDQDTSGSYKPPPPSSNPPPPPPSPSNPPPRPSNPPPPPPPSNPPPPSSSNPPNPPPPPPSNPPPPPTSNPSNPPPPSSNPATPLTLPSPRRSTSGPPPTLSSNPTPPTLPSQRRFTSSAGESLLPLWTGQLSKVFKELHDNQNASKKQLSSTSSEISGAPTDTTIPHLPTDQTLHRDIHENNVRKVVAYRQGIVAINDIYRFRIQKSSDLDELAKLVLEKRQLEELIQSVFKNARDYARILGFSSGFLAAFAIVTDHLSSITTARKEVWIGFVVLFIVYLLANNFHVHYILKPTLRNARERYATLLLKTNMARCKLVVPNSTPRATPLIEEESELLEQIFDAHCREIGEPLSIVGPRRLCYTELNCGALLLLICFFFKGLSPSMNLLSRN